ncbi:acyl-CoA dehydrogenase family protein [Streptomyces broussonetiae]|uniref:acyl-CoA dehydrogenase family protein n=1 Tax=Streptomyces broussonetiae TaxID=2686304 RepID=UPI001E379CD2
MPGEADGGKAAGTKAAVATYRMCQEIAGEAGRARSGSPAVLGGGGPERLNRTAQTNTFGGGVSEVQRETVATTRLGCARTACTERAQRGPA